jgi:5-methylthioadenosine/S-adenosylhomocysteine deaminase
LTATITAILSTAVLSLSAPAPELSEFSSEVTVSNADIVITSKWICPVTSPPIYQGAIAIRDSRIQAVGARDAILSEFKEFEQRDYGDAIVVPGLINLHSHLDYAALADIETNAGLFDWIPMLMRSVAKWTSSDFFESALYGARLNALAGTTMIVDSSYSGQSAEAIAAAGLKGVVGLELFGLDKNNFSPAWESWLQRFEKLSENGSKSLKQAIEQNRIVLTCAPHAPYTVCPPLWKLASEWAEAKQLPLLAHMAESISECNWLKGDDDVIDAFIMKVMPSSPERDTKAILKAIDWKKSNHSPVAFLQAHGLLSKRLVAAHSIHVDEDDIGTLKSAGVSIAHCPRSNARLRNGRAPLPAYLKAGVNAGLGTDGLPSTDSLNLVAEANFAVNLHRAVEPDCRMTGATLLELMTIGGARAIGMDDKIGALEKGKQADIAVFKIAPGEKDLVPDIARKLDSALDPAEILIRFPIETEAVFVDGEAIVEGGRLRNVQTCARQ